MYLSQTTHLVIVLEIMSIDPRNVTPSDLNIRCGSDLRVVTDCNHVFCDIFFTLHTSFTPTLSPAKPSGEPMMRSHTSLLIHLQSDHTGHVTESDSEEDPEEYEDDETEDGPVDYPMDGGDDRDDDDGDSSRDDADGKDEDEEDEDERGLGALSSG
ncbi:hypothetical protein Tco_0645487 [Tanacetum coccineum]